MILGLGVGVGHDSAADLVRHAVAFDRQGADRDVERACAAAAEIPENREKMSPAVPAKVVWINLRRFFTIPSRV